MTVLLGYCDRWSAAPGGRVRFMVSCEGAAEYRADLVRLHASRLGPDAPPCREEEIESPVNGHYPARTQAIHAGSFAIVDPAPSLPAPGSFTLQAYVWPTMPGDRPQALLGTWSEATGHGFGLFLDADGALALRLDEQTLGTGVPLAPRHWYLVAGRFDAARGLARVVQIPCAGHRFHPFTPAAREAAMRASAPGPGPFVIAARHAGDAGTGTAHPCLCTGHFDGKIERPRLSAGALDDESVEALGAHPPTGAGLESLLSAWDFSRDTSGTRIVDIGPARRDGHCVNLPARAMTGHTWSGESPDWRQAPTDYGAIHFHRDDIHDCGWESDFELEVPDGLPSAVYAARLRAGEAEHHLPFYVRAPRGGPTADIAFLAPTATYMAYANIITLSFDPLSEAVNGGLTVFDKGDLLHLERPELGLSTYDHHRDGSGVCYSSRLRPVLAMQPLSRMWGFTVDMLIVDWLEHAGLGFDVITDEDLHREGEELLSRYRVVVTGSHPEYYSLRMLDALEGWLNAGGRLMYMGGNGFYWRIAFHPELPGVIEVRRAEGGIRTWAAQAGEYHMSFTGELGGMWRRQRRPPNLIAGVGFISQGFDSGAPYRRRPAAADPRARVHLRGRRRGGGRRFRSVPRRGRELGARLREPAARDPRPRPRPGELGGPLQHLRARARGDAAEPPDDRRHPEPRHPRRHGLLRDAGGRRGVLHRLHRLRGRARRRPLRQRHRAPHHQRAAALRGPCALRDARPVIARAGLLNCRCPPERMLPSLSASGGSPVPRE